MTVEVQLSKYKFLFRPLTWREEASLKFPPNSNPLRYILAAALVEVSGLPVASADEAMKVFRPMPIPILDRVFKVYKNGLPKNRRFETADLFRAPSPESYDEQVKKDDSKIEEVADEVVRRMEAKFGEEEVREAAEIDRQVVRGSKLRGAVRKS